MPSASWYLNRLSLMSPGEIAWRVQQSALERWTGWRGEPAAPQAIAAPKLLAWSAPTNVAAAPYVEVAERILAGENDLYGDWIAAPSGSRWNSDPRSGLQSPRVRGMTLDYRDAALVGNARDIWEVNRHLQIVRLAQAWALTRDTRFAAGARDLLIDWLRECPYPTGINWASALEAGIRLMNQYIAARMLGPEYVTAIETAGWRESIYRHCTFIWAHRSKHSSANNHLLGEMAGLYVAASAWPCWPESARWRREAHAILERESAKQIHADGVSREQAVGYQPFIAQMLLLPGLVGEATGDSFSSAYWARIQAMIGFQQSIRDGDGSCPAFGDADDGMALLLTPVSRERTLDELVDLDDAFTARAAPHLDLGAWLLSGLPVPSNWPREALPIRREFPDGGYYILGDEGTRVVFDAAPLGYLSIAAHGHADCLSFTLAIDGKPFLIDPGTYCYHSEPRWRRYFRGTSAHNTVRIDGEDQSEPGGEFMWLRKAKPSVLGRELDGAAPWIRASHNGYKRLRDPVVHTRELRLDLTSRTIVVQDHLEARGSHVVERFWHFAPGIEVTQTGEREVTARSPQSTLTLQFDSPVELQISHGDEASPSGWWSPRFGVREPIFTLKVTAAMQGPASFSSQLTWQTR